METNDAPARAIFHFFIRVQDEDGWMMDVFVNSDQVRSALPNCMSAWQTGFCTQKSSLIDGLDANLIDDARALRAFRKRMAHFAGNIGDTTPGTKPPLLHMTVHNWIPSTMDVKSDRIFELVTVDEVRSGA
jgi:hypothetical protein